MDLFKHSLLTSILVITHLLINICSTNNIDTLFENLQQKNELSSSNSEKSKLTSHTNNIKNNNNNNNNERPNIIFFLTDDWGFNDIGYNGNTNTQTPFISSLAKEESLIISKYYVTPLCSVTRCALLTGRYPMRYGLQSQIIFQTSNYALSKQETLLSNEFQSQGYSTHLIGKWHAGYIGWDYTPTYRGFDSFLGYYGGDIDYYQHSSDESGISGYDFRVGTNEYEFEEENQYSLYIYRDQIESSIIELSTSEDPFFMYVGWQGSHFPSQAPDDYLSLYSDSDTDERINFQAQTTLTDELFGSIINTIKTSGIWDNTLIIFASDNGADKVAGDNSPLRGSKGSLFEGGIRVPAFITGGYLPNDLKGTVFDSYPMHVTDWYPTLLAVSGLEISSSNELDGKNMWQLLTAATGDQKSDHDDVDYIYSQALITTAPELQSRTSVASLPEERIILLNTNSDGCNSYACGALIYGGKWKILINSESNYNWIRDFQIDATNDALECGIIPTDVNTDPSLCADEVCLFDLDNDPCEYYDISDNYPVLTENLYTILKSYYNEQVPPLYSNIGYVDDASVLAPVKEDGTQGYWTPLDEIWQTNEFEEFLKPYYARMKNLKKSTGFEGSLFDYRQMKNVWINIKHKYHVNGTNIAIFVCFVVIIVSFSLFCISMIMVRNNNNNNNNRNRVNFNICKSRKGVKSANIEVYDETTMLLPDTSEDDEYLYTVTL